MYTSGDIRDPFLPTSHLPPIKPPGAAHSLSAVHGVFIRENWVQSSSADYDPSTYLPGRQMQVSIPLKHQPPMMLEQVIPGQHRSSKGLHASICHKHVFCSGCRSCLSDLDERLASTSASRFVSSDDDPTEADHVTCDDISTRTDTPRINVREFMAVFDLLCAS